MTTGTSTALRLLDVAPGRDAFAADVVRGLRRPRKRLPCKYFYDDDGAALFERICELPEYYPTRTELSIMRNHAREMAAEIGGGAAVVELGSGAGVKTRVLLTHLADPAAYVPVDISRQQLAAAARSLATAYPRLRIAPVCADFTGDFALPALGGAGRRVVYFPGSTIGNLDPDHALAFLRRMREICGRGGMLLIGADLKKDPRLLHAAYNDSAGVTAAFNLNLLARINRELNGTFALDRFAHYAFYNPRRGRVEMHLVSRAEQTCEAAGESFRFAEGESIFTESSHKFTIPGFAALASAAGFAPRRTWTDEHRLFSVQLFTTR